MKKKYNPQDDMDAFKDEMCDNIDQQLVKDIVEEIENEGPLTSEHILQMVGRFPNESKEDYEKRKANFESIFSEVVNTKGIKDSSVKFLEEYYTELDKPNYLSKDGTIKEGLEMFGNYYAPKNDLSEKD